MIWQTARVDKSIETLANPRILYFCQTALISNIRGEYPLNDHKIPKIGVYQNILSICVWVKLDTSNDFVVETRLY